MTCPDYNAFIHSFWEEGEADQILTRGGELTGCVLRCEASYRHKAKVTGQRVAILMCQLMPCQELQALGLYTQPLQARAV